MVITVSTSRYATKIGYEISFSEAELDKAHNYVELWNPYYLEPGDPKVKDRDQYLYWLTRAADHGSVKAERELAWVCYAGKVTNRDLDKAIFYLEKAALQGDKDAIFELDTVRSMGKMRRRNLRHSFSRR